MLQVFVGSMLLVNKRVTGARGEKCTMTGTGRLRWSAALALCLLALLSGFAAANEHGNFYAIASTISVVSIARGNNEWPVIEAISNFSSHHSGTDRKQELVIQKYKNDFVTLGFNGLALLNGQLGLNIK